MIDLTDALPFLNALKRQTPIDPSIDPEDMPDLPAEGDASAPGAAPVPPVNLGDLASLQPDQGLPNPNAIANPSDNSQGVASAALPPDQGSWWRPAGMSKGNALLSLLARGLIGGIQGRAAEEQSIVASGGHTGGGFGTGFLGAQETPIRQGLEKQQLQRWGLENSMLGAQLQQLPFIQALTAQKGLADLAHTQAETASIPAETALKTTEANAGRFKEMNGAIYDTAGGKLTPAIGAQASSQDWDALVDRAIPPGQGNDALNKRTHQIVDFYLGQGNVAGAQKTLTEAGAQIGTIEKETNPAVQQGKINVAEAEGRAKALMDQQLARGSVAALANVPKELITPATSAATKAGEDYAAAQAVTQRMQATMDAARRGNVEAYQIIPEEGTLQVTTSQGVHRINRAEIEQYAGGGSLWQNMMGKFGKALTGQSIPASVLDDMAEIQKIQAEGSRSKYENSLRTINQNYGSNFQPVTYGNQSPAPAGHIIRIGNKQYQYKGSGDTADLSNYNPL